MTGEFWKEGLILEAFVSGAVSFVGVGEANGVSVNSWVSVFVVAGDFFNKFPAKIIGDICGVF